MNDQGEDQVGQQFAMEGMLDAVPSSSDELLLNLRAVGSAEEERSNVESHVNQHQRRQNRLFSSRSAQARATRYANPLVIRLRSSDTRQNGISSSEI
jgi:hypothetical protein